MENKYALDIAKAQFKFANFKLHMQKFQLGCLAINSKKTD